VGCAFEVVLAGWQRPPAPQPLLDAAVVSVHIQVKRVDVAVFKVANNDVAAKVALAIAAVAREFAVVPASSLMPGLGRHVVNPCGVAAWERQHIKSMAFLLVCVGDGV
jgi:HJR/Mrr/RecB family endonuclease